jgi:hypothetical protein
VNRSRRRLLTKHRRVGDRYSEVWKAGAITLKVDYVVLKTCVHGMPTEENGCEGIVVKATITATDGKAKQTIRASGYCGC